MLPSLALQLVIIHTPSPTPPPQPPIERISHNIHPNPRYRPISPLINSRIKVIPPKHTPKGRIYTSQPLNRLHNTTRADKPRPIIRIIQHSQNHSRRIPP